MPTLQEITGLSDQARHSRAKTRAGSDVGRIPPPKNPGRRQACARDLVLFAQWYFPHTMGLSPLSPAHIRAFERMQRSIISGGYFLQVVFRGFAKTTSSEVAILWGVLYGHIRFPVPIAADSGAAKQFLESIKTELETNDRLAEDFPEVCVPVAALEGRPQRCGSQHQDGTPTHIEWTADYIVLPSVLCHDGAPSPSGGAVVKPRGMTANLRGIRHKRPDGQQARPDFVILDDPQTDEAARSPDQVEKNLKTLNKAILRLGGHDRRLAAVCNATIIEPDDFVAKLANPQLFPAWQTERVPMLESFADAHESLWLEEYAKRRNSYNPDVPGDQDRAHAEATAYYAENREAMDRGAKATWLSCYERETEISAIQHAYNILIDTTFESFMAECQNDPVSEQADIECLTSTEIQRKQNGYARGEFPKECRTVTAFIDVQGSLLYWLVAAWQDDFSGYVLDYGAWPDQSRSYFTLRDARKTLRRRYRGTDDEGAIFAGLTDCIAHICGREWRRIDGATLRVARCFVDANWGNTSTTVQQCCRQSPFANVLTPSFGRGIKATQRPISQWQQAKKVRCGPEWTPTQAKGRQLVGVLYDANYWKKRFHDALALPLGNRGAISLFKQDPLRHRMLADHLAAETPKRVESGGRVVFEWSLPPGRDNHLLDCAVGSMVAASACGVTHLATPKRPAKRRGKVKYL